jgi:hypothetical protein
MACCDFDGMEWQGEDDKYDSERKSTKLKELLPGNRPSDVVRSTYPCYLEMY